MRSAGELRAMTAAVRPGECRYCHCTEDCPCSLSDGDTCLLNSETMVCSGPRCITQLSIDVEKNTARQWRQYLEQRRARSFQNRQRRKKKKGGKAA